MFLESSIASPVDANKNIARDEVAASFYNDITSIMRGDKTEENQCLVTDGNRIEWGRDVLSAYRQARDSRKPLVVLFTDDSCHYCHKLQNEALQDPRVRALANSGVFLIANPETDSNAANMANSLKINGYPIVAVLDAQANAINEIGRVVGYMSADEFSRQFANLMPGSPRKDITDPIQGPAADQVDFGAVASLYEQLKNSQS